MIEVAGLVKRYRKAKRNAVDGISFDVRAGEFFALLGPNGAGKTTTIDALTGFTRSTGAVTFDGRDQQGLNPHQRVKHGLSRTF